MKRVLYIWMALCLFFCHVPVYAENEESGVTPETAETGQSEEIPDEEEPDEEIPEDTPAGEEAPEEQSGDEENGAEEPQEEPGEEDPEDPGEEDPEDPGEEEPADEPEPEPLSGPAGFTDRMYRIVLAREKDEAGAADWTGRLERREMTGADVAFGFFMSPEMQDRDLTDGEYINTAYLAVLDREADEEGLNTWIQVLSDGMSRLFVLAGFTNSVEFGELCQSYGIDRGTLTSPYYRDKRQAVTRFVSGMYRELLCREGEDYRIENWCRNLLTKTITAAAAVDGFFSGREYLQKETSDAVFAAQCYRVFFDREPDDAGMAVWLARLDVGMTRRSIENGFAGSQEFIRLCAKNGLTPGTVPVTAYRDRSYELTKFVSTVYRGLLGRDADVSGLETHARLLYLRNLGGKQMIRIFAESKEFQQRVLSNEEYVQVLYRGVLGRSASEAETISNVNKLQSYGRTGLLELILKSPEFKERCRKAGIQAELANPIASLDSAMSASSIAGFNGWVLTSAEADMLRTAVNTVERRGYSIGFVMLDLTSGKGISYHPDMTFYSASAIKAPYIVSLAKYNYTGFLQVRSTAEDVLHTSSNTGYANLWKTFHGATFAEFGEDANVRSAVTADMYAYLSAREMAKLWAVCDEYFNSGAAGDSVGSLCEDPNVSSIRAVIPGNVNTRSKAGWISGYGYRSSTDAGIVYASNGRYVIALLSDLPASVNDLDPVVMALHAVHSHLNN